MVIAFTVICVALNISVDTVVADVDGMKIYAGEVKLHMNEIKTDVIEYFEQNYSVTAGNDFWDTEFDGVTPAEYLRNEAMPGKRSLQPEGLLPSRGVAGSGFPPLPNIPHCCLP